jgi:cell shape-determining protein MreD
MATLIAFPIFTILVMFQSAVITKVHLLYGMADVVLLTVIAWSVNARVQTAWQWGLIGGILAGLTTAVPFGVVLAGYMGTTAIASLLRRRAWQLPIVAMFITTFFGTALIHGLSLLAIWLGSTSLPLLQSLNLITLPSLLLNLLLALPVYILVNDLADWVYPKKIEA